MKKQKQILYNIQFSKKIMIFSLKTHMEDESCAHGQQAPNNIGFPFSP